MENWWRYCLSGLVLICFVGCDSLSNETYKHLDPNERRRLSAKYVSLSHRIMSGSPKHMRILEKATRINSENEQAWRALSFPYLYRGLYQEWNDHTEKAIELNPEAWQGSRGHTKLFYFRDYGGALYDLDATDTLTVDKIDYIQNQSVDYLRALCYLGLKNYEKTREYLEKYLEEEEKKESEVLVDQTAYIYKGIVELYFQNYDTAIEHISRATAYRSPLADGFYHRAYAYFMKGEIEEAYSDIQRAKELFEEDEYHKAHYYEVINQIYLYDINKLAGEIECFR